MYIVKINKKNCDLLRLGSLFLLGLNSAPHSHFPFSDQPGRERKRGGATSVDSRVTG